MAACVSFHAYIRGTPTLSPFICSLFFSFFFRFFIFYLCFFLSFRLATGNFQSLVHFLSLNVHCRSLFMDQTVKLHIFYLFDSWSILPPQISSAFLSTSFTCFNLCFYCFYLRSFFLSCQILYATKIYTPTAMTGLPRCHLLHATADEE